MNDTTMSMMKDSMGMMTGMDMTAMHDLIEACAACEQACTMCASADAGLSGMKKCVALCLNCAETCNTMMRMTMRPVAMDPDSMTAMLLATKTVASACAAECLMHADINDQCRLCAESCRQVVSATEVMMASLKSMASASS